MIGFLQPIYLFGLILASIPIIIHFWFKKRLAKVEFSSVRFLYTIERRQFNWLRLREIVVLILRTLIIVSLFLALARPLVRTNFLGLSRTASVFLLFDDSYSMAYNGRLEKARAAAIKLINHYTPASQFLISPLCHEKNLEFFNRERAIKTINDLTQSFKPGDLKRGFEQLEPFVSNAQYPIEIIFITDRQAKTFAAAKEPFSPSVKILDVAAKAEDNIGVTEARLKDPVAITAPKIVAKVKNFGPNAWSGTISLNTGAESKLVLRGKEEKTIFFPLPSSQKTVVGWIKIESDFLSLDNVRFFVLRPAREKQILIITSASPLDKSAGYYVGQALAPPGAASPNTVEIVPQHQIGRIDLSAYDTIILAEIEGLTAYAIKKIESFLSQKPVLILLGQPPTTKLKEWLSKYCDIENPVTASGFMTISWFEKRHAIFEIFGPKDFANIKFFQILSLKPKQTKILMTINNEFPLLVEGKNMLISATAFNIQNADMALKPIFVPFVHRLVGYLTQDKMIRDYHVGQPIKIASSDAAVVHTPSSVERVIPEGREIVYRKTGEPGIYQIGQERFAVNVEPAEGDLNKIGLKTLQELNCQVQKPEDVFRGADLALLFQIICITALIIEMAFLIFR